MLVLAHLLKAIAITLRVFIYVELASVSISVIFSWVSPHLYHPARKFFDALSSIVLEPLRRVIPPVGIVDVSPAVAILILTFLDGFLVELLLDLAVRLV